MTRLARFCILSLLITAGAVAVPSVSHASPEAGATADEVMGRAMTEANATHKNILVMFGASWCGNCRLFDRFLADPEMHPLMDRAFVFVDLNTGEHTGDQRHANIPGGQKLQISLAGRMRGTRTWRRQTRAAT